MINPNNNECIHTLGKFYYMFWSAWIRLTPPPIPLPPPPSASSSRELNSHELTKSIWYVLSFPDSLIQRSRFLSAKHQAHFLKTRKVKYDLDNWAHNLSLTKWKFTGQTSTIWYPRCHYIFIPVQILKSHDISLFPSLVPLTWVNEFSIYQLFCYPRHIFAYIGRICSLYCWNYPAC